jgi:hypothetical protein
MPSMPKMASMKDRIAWAAEVGRAAAHQDYELIKENEDLLAAADELHNGEKTAGAKEKALLAGGGAAAGTLGTLGVQRGIREGREARIEKSLRGAPGRLGQFYETNPKRREEVATFLSKLPKKKPVGVRGRVGVAPVSDPQLAKIKEYRKAMKKQASPGFMKLASVLCGYDVPKAVGDGEAQDTMWCERFAGTPLFEQAKQLELEDAQLDMERAQYQAQREEREDADRDWWRKQDALRAQRDALEAQLRMHKLQGGAEQPAPEEQMPQEQVPEQQPEAAPEQPPAEQAPAEASAEQPAPAPEEGQEKTASAKDFLKSFLER